MNFKLLIEDFFDLLFPRCCDACDKCLVGNETLICTACRISLPRIEKESIHTDVVKFKFTHIPEVCSTRAFLLFTKRGKVQKLLHALKYKGNQEVGVLLGFMFGQEMILDNTFPDAELIISVPLHRNKISKRGYNQSELIAKGLSRASNIPWSDTALTRIRYTDTQTGKSKKERQDNVRGVFRTCEGFFQKRVILIDDVLTTGATLEACVEALKEGGCKEFHILAIAVAEH